MILKCTIEFREQGSEVRFRFARRHSWQTVAITGFTKYRNGLIETTYSIRWTLCYSPTQSFPECIGPLRPSLPSAIVVRFKNGAEKPFIGDSSKRPWMYAVGVVASGEKFTNSLGGSLSDDRLDI